MGSEKQPVVVHVVHALAGGGTERMLVSLLKAFDPTRLRHIVVTLREAGPLAANLPDHAACQPIAATGRSLLAGCKLARFARRWGAEVIHARNTGCWNDAILARVLTPRARLVLGFHGLETAQPFKGKQRTSARWGLHAGARFVSVSHSGCGQLHEQAHIPWRQIDVLPNGVDPRTFEAVDQDARRRIRDTLHLSDEAFIVGIVGSLTSVKHHTTLISAVAQVSACVPNIELVIVGDGPLRDGLRMQARCEGVGSRVHFTGWREDVPAMLAAMDAYVCCSESEGMNNALLEAMAAGLPLIATDAGDNARMVRDAVEGCIVKPHAPKAIAEALCLFVRDPELRRRFATAARARAKEYTFDQTVRRYERYYETLAGLRRTADGHAFAARSCRLG